MSRTVTGGSSVAGSRQSSRPSSVADPQELLLNARAISSASSRHGLSPPSTASQLFPAPHGDFSLVRAGGEVTLQGMRRANDDDEARAEQAALKGDLEEEDRIARERALFESQLAEFKAGRRKNLTLPTGVRMVSDVDGDLTSFPQSGCMVRVDYEVRLLQSDGTPTYDAFDTTRALVPFDFQLGVGYTIPAMEDALLVMSRGQRCRIRVPPLQGYGRLGYPPTVPPNADLLLDVELISFE